MSQPDSSPQIVLSRREFVLNSPQYSFSPKKRFRSQDEESNDDESVPYEEESPVVIDSRALEEQQRRERERLLKEIENETRILERNERRIINVRIRSERERNKEQNDKSQIDSTSNNSGLLPNIYTSGVLSTEEEELEKLESILREMDDNTLTAILTHEQTTDSVEKLLSFLPKEKPATVLAPARSAGVEGTGSGLQLDEEGQKLTNAIDEDNFDRLVEDTLRARLERSEELAECLKRFTGLNLESIETSLPTSQSGNGSSLIRHLTIRGTLMGDLGSIILDMDVSESSKDVLPQIITLDVDVNHSIYYAIGASTIKSFVESNNLPAVLLGIQTLTPIAIARFKLFSSICNTYPELASEQIDKLERNGISMRSYPTTKGTQEQILSQLPPLSLLINPNYLEKVTLQNVKGAGLDLIFRIEFNRFGHAKPHLTIQPKIPQQYILNQEVQDFVDEIPSKFLHFCAHKPSYLDMRGALIAVIDAFFLHS